MMNTKTGGFKSKLAGPWAYFGLVYLFWVFAIPAALSSVNVNESPALMVAYVLGGLGPPVAAILLTYLTQDQAGRHDYWRRIVDFRRIGLKWYGVIFLTWPVITALAALLDRLLGGEGLRLELAARFLEQPLLILPFALFYLLFGPLPEEIGWRGYALDRLQVRWNALTSSLILGAAWALWHLPTFFVRGTYQHNLGFGTLSFWILMLEIMPGSILQTWIYNNTGRSTLSAILLHFMGNFTGELFELSARAEIYSFLLAIAAAIIVVLSWGPKTLTRQPETSDRIPSA
jgi:membrane protease YdiL (CAAX protease family)